MTLKGWRVVKPQHNQMYTLTIIIAPDKRGDLENIFLIPAQKHMLWELDEALLMSTHNICFCAGIRKVHYENTPFQVYWKFYHQKNENFQIKILIFFILLPKT